MAAVAAAAVVIVGPGQASGAEEDPFNPDPFAVDHKWALVNSSSQTVTIHYKVLQGGRIVEEGDNAPLAPGAKYTFTRNSHDVSEIRYRVGSGRERAWQNDQDRCIRYMGLGGQYDFLYQSYEQCVPAE